MTGARKLDSIEEKYIFHLIFPIKRHGWLIQIPVYGIKTSFWPVCFNLQFVDALLDFKARDATKIISRT